jgi:hypothetical protein
MRIKAVPASINYAAVHREDLLRSCIAILQERLTKLYTTKQGHFLLERVPELSCMTL